MYGNVQMLLTKHAYTSWLISYQQPSHRQKRLHHTFQFPILECHTLRSSYLQNNCFSSCCCSSTKTVQRVQTESTFVQIGVVKDWWIDYCLTSNLYIVRKCTWRSLGVSAQSEDFNLSMNNPQIVCSPLLALPCHVSIHAASQRPRRIT